MSLPSVLVVILATIFAAAHMTAARRRRGRKAITTVGGEPACLCGRAGFLCRLRPKQAARECNKLLLPFATSINGSYAGASLAGTTAMISELTAFVRDMRELDRAWPEYKLGGCIRMAEGAVGGAKEQMATLSRFYALGDDKVGEFGLSEVMKWIDAVETDFQHECSHGAAQG
ncbi:hypothetical protein HU200_011084 [Digitaria exilis]|uniref:Uncharacterized protein n=1 Tax=Digitaria exilis TaxID=1010633 RepID=A0A835FH09_9POAL|nr:hypothetical protein HU200_011084 [Digitaria exilis]